MKSSGGTKIFILCAMTMCWAIVGGVVGIIIIVACVFLNNQFSLFPLNGAIFGIPIHIIGIWVVIIGAIIPASYCVYKWPIYRQKFFPDDH